MLRNERKWKSIYSMFPQKSSAWQELTLEQVYAPANERRRYKVTPSLIGWA